MKSVIVVLVLLLSSVAAADKPSLSGHWQHTSGHHFFLHHKANGDANVWTVVADRRIGFEKGNLVLLAPEDGMVGALYEINAKSDETVIIHASGKACEVKNLSFSLLGVLRQWGWRKRQKEFRAVGLVSGTMVCGQQSSPWLLQYLGSWKRM